MEYVKEPQETIYPQTPRPKEKMGHPVYGRQVQPAETRDTEEPAPAEYIAKAFARMQQNLQLIVKGQIDEFKIFDQYLPQSALGVSVTTISLPPTYEYTERVESIIITGPAGTVSLALGDRLWNLTIPAAGILVIAPVSVYLDRNDGRTLTAGTPGNYTLELMGHADARWST